MNLGRGDKKYIQDFVWELLVKWPLGRLRKRKNNIKKNSREIDYRDVRWMELPQDCFPWQALVLVTLNLWILVAESLVSQFDGWLVGWLVRD
jgi:hypothetical protein